MGVDREAIRLKGMVRAGALVMALLLCTAQMQAQQKLPEGIWEGYDGEWAHVSSQLVALAEATPAEKFAWRPVAPLEALIPTSPALQQCTPDSSSTCLPNPNLPNAVWFAVAAQTYDPTAQTLITPQTRQGNSLDRSLLSAFVGATYPAGAQRISWNYMQANVYNGFNIPAAISDDYTNVTQAYDFDQDAPYNDVIVVQKSALNDAGLLGGDMGGPAEQYTPNGLAHNQVPFSSILSLLFPGSNNSVTNDNCVNQYVAMWLGYLATVSCASAPPTPQAEEPLTKAEASLLDTDDVEQPGKETDERLSAELPNYSLKLGQPAQLHVNVTRADLVSLSIEQDAGDDSYENISTHDNSQVGSGEAKVIEDDGTSKIVEFVPLQVGQVSLRTTALYADGGIAHQEYTVNVVPRSDGIHEFLLNGLSTMAIFRDAGGDDPHSKLKPRIQYDNLQYPIYLNDCNGITLSVEQPDNPVVRVDSDGTVHALRPGRAIVLGELGGVHDQVIVNVYDRDREVVGHELQVHTSN